MCTEKTPLKTDYNVRDDLKDMPLEELQAYQKSVTIPAAMAFVNLNGDLNLGVAIRSAVIFGFRDLFVFGNKTYDKRSTVGAHNYINMHLIKTDIVDNDIDRDVVINTLADYGYMPVCIEKNKNSYSFDADSRSFNYLHETYNVCFIFGNEGYGLSDKFIGNLLVYHIDQPGIMRSLNVSAAASIIGYEWRKKYGTS